MSGVDIDQAACRRRQRRLLDRMAELKVDLAIVSQIEHVQWLTGPRFDWKLQPLAALWADGTMVLIAPSDATGPAAADDVLSYDAKWLSTLRQDQRAAASQVLLSAVGRRSKPRSIGVEFSSFPTCLAEPLCGRLIDLEADLLRLRRRKEADELARLKNAIAATGAMYARARQVIAPGVNELDVFDELQAVAVREFGEPLTGTGNDYASGVHGGPP
ncbi:MAG TPA: aminopeptidase P family N-terminal domain-containing protein, partial [Pirellulales bacterium]